MSANRLWLIVLALVGCSRPDAEKPPQAGVRVRDPGPPDPSGIYAPMRPEDRPDASDFVERQLALRVQALPRDLVPASSVERGIISSDERADFPLDTRPGRCYRVIAVAGLGVNDLTLKLYAGFIPSNNTRIETNTDKDGYPTLGVDKPFCPPAGGRFIIEVSTQTGRGTFGAQVFMTP